MARLGTLVAWSVLVAGLSGCAVVAPGAAAPGSGTTTPIAPTAAPSIPTPAPTPTQASPVSPPLTPSGSATRAAAKAKGKLVLYRQNLVSDVLAGTCVRKDGKPTLRLADDSTDFFESVEVTVVLSEAADEAVSVGVDLGADSESITHTLTATADGAQGTSAALARSGDSFTVTGTGTMTDDGVVSATRVPYAITVTCSGQDW
ncbi:MAG: lipoprotein LpqH [Propionicimonas sp.]